MLHFTINLLYKELYGYLYKFEFIFWSSRHLTLTNQLTLISDLELLLRIWSFQKIKKVN